MAVGIKGYGVYIPKYRIKREDIGKAWNKGGRGENSIANHDEDVLTMAMEASENAISQCGLDPASKLDAIYFASTSKPYIEQSSIGIIAQTLGARDEDIEMSDFGATTRASSSALKACADAVEAGRIDHGLVVSADCREAAAGSDQEMNFGAGAASFILGKDDAVAEIECTASYQTYFMETWRGTEDKYVRLLEMRYSREWGYENHVKKAAQMLMSKLNLSGDGFQHLVLQYPSDIRRAAAVARELGFKPQQTEKAAPAQGIGDCGNASVPLGIISVLDQSKPGDRIMAVFYGSGMADAVSLVVKEGIEKVRGNGKSLQHYLDSKKYVDYMSFMMRRGIMKDPREASVMGIRSDSPLWSRDGTELWRLLGNKCTKCGYINHPPSQRKICIKCGSTELELVLMSRKGKVHSFTYDLYAPPPLFAPVVTFILTLDDGTTFRVLGTEVEPEELKIGMPIELVLRRVSVERGVSSYSRYYGRPPR